jgi:glutamate 5-kinase
MKRIIVKIGSNILAPGDNGLDVNRIQTICNDISAVRDRDFEVVIVSSGAVAAGMKKLRLKEKPRDIIVKQAAAAVGQSSLMWAYEKCFTSHNKKVAQILLTRDDFADRKRYINSRNALLALLSFGIIPVVNENDTVATDEIRFGDNDHLAALVAGMIEAERLIILSDVDGLFTEDPRANAGAELIETVEDITPDLEKRAGKAGTAVGTGGMYSKVLAAKRAVRHGIAVNIVNGRFEGVITSLIDGCRTGTAFRPQRTRLSSKKGWIAYACRTKGVLTVDDGAARALLHGGKSLLPSGIVSLSGRFDAGDAVYCADMRGHRIAKGVTNYSSSEIEQIKGKKTSEIDSILGYRYSDEVIHRDNLALL